MSALGAISCQNQSKLAENTVNFLKKRAPKARAKKNGLNQSDFGPKSSKIEFSNFRGGGGGGGGGVPSDEKNLGLGPSFEKNLVPYASLITKELWC